MDASGLSSSRNTSTSFLRVISLSIAFYDYILTLPAEWRFYRSQRSWRLSLGCVLFIAIRYASIAVLILSNVGYFGDFFTPETCDHYYMAPPIFKVVQTMVSQMILGIRTINISRRSTWVTWSVVTVFFLCTAAQWILNLWNRVPVQGRHNNCTAGNKPPVLTVWLYYLLSIVFDIFTLGVSSMYLISFSPNSGKMAHLRRIMLTDGLVYFVALTGVNIFNLILYRRPDEAMQSSGVSLGYALTWIMSQRILIHLRDAAAAHNRTITTQIVVSRALPSAHSVAAAMRSQYDRDRGTKGRERHLDLPPQHTALTSGFDVDWSWMSSERRTQTGGGTGGGGGYEGDVERSAGTGTRSCGSRCTCDCGWGSCSGSGFASGSGTRTGTGSASSGVGPVASATLGPSSSRRGRTRSRAFAPEDGDLEFDEKGMEEMEEEGEAPEVRVQIEETVTVELELEYDPEAFEKESYRTPRVLWEVRPAIGTKTSGQKGGGGGGGDAGT
ncbi:hypothetical protein BV20DRAFT_194023 [Pilatotrama ljubarskyi]|nr:hypothetical protein BV20DRAFT_194023 [Pilatotrama ljubarskyi]